MEFKEISKEEVQIGDWFKCLRISNKKQKIPKLENGAIKTVMKGGGKVELSLDDSNVTFYRNIERPPQQNPTNSEESNEPDKENQQDTKGESETSEEELAEDDQPPEATDEQIQEVRDHLDTVDGIGDSKIDSLINSGYNTLERLRDAEIGGLTDVDGIGDSKAKDIKLSLIQ